MSRRLNSPKNPGDRTYDTPDTSAFFSVLVTAILLILSFPRFSFSFLAWVAWVPMFFILPRVRNAIWAFIYFYFAGVFFLLGSVEWLRHVAYAGWYFVVLLFAFYYGFFGIFAYWFLKKRNDLASILAIPSIYIILEWVRTEIPIFCFGWNLLAYTQANHFTVAQVASSIGAYGVSWILILGNLSVYFLVRFLRNRGKEKLKPAIVSFLVVIFVIVCTWLGRSFVLNKTTGAVKETKIAVIQPGILQEEKWDEKNKSKVIQLHENLTRLISYEKPDLIVWPEAAFPGFFNIDPDRESILKLEKEIKIPLLVGSPALDMVREVGKSIVHRSIVFNSAFLVTGEANMDRYDKIRLVPFGEYVPWPGFFGLFGVEKIARAMGVGDFAAGEQMKVFSFGENKKFSALICFEDTFPFLARRAVSLGAQFLVVITNDAWFLKSAAPYQHLQASQFRAIENAVPVVRSANTGVSAFIDPHGRVIDRVKDKRGKDTFIIGALMRPVSLGNNQTIYQRFGYLFPYFCFSLFFVSFMMTLMKKHSRIKGE